MNWLMNTGWAAPGALLASVSEEAQSMAGRLTRELKQHSAGSTTEFMVHQASFHSAFSLEKVKRERRGWHRSWQPQLFWEQEGQSAALIYDV